MKNIISKIVAPFVWLLSVSSETILKILRVKTSAGAVTEEEIKAFVQESTDSGEIQKIEQEIVITSTEFQLMKVFMNNKGIILNRERLIQLAFGYEYEGFDRNIDTYIKRLRQKIEDNSKNPVYLITKYGAGYVFGGEIK